MVKSYRDNFNIFAVNGICYNHTSKYRMSSFVSRKIVDAAKKINNGEDAMLELGNLTPVREWGYAKDYAYAMWLTLQQDKPTDYIISTGVGYSVKELVERVFRKINIDITWEGTGIDEVGKDQNGIVRVKISPDFIRPYDPEVLVGNPEKFEKITGYKLVNNIDEVIDSMLEE
jgi:GDPmannose 4,6-dehydratase